MDATALIELAARAPSLLVATDYDGTISDIATNPMAACPREGAIEALAAITRAPGAVVALISGRTTESLRAQTRGLDGVWRSSEHGAFLEAPAGPLVRLAPPVPEATLAALGDAANALKRRIEGARVELKQTGVSIHLREVAPERRPAALAMLAGFEAIAAEHGFVILSGRNVIEARGPAHTKASALATIANQLPDETTMLFAGDDQTDDDAIQLAHDRGGVGVYVASTERPLGPRGADIVLTSPAEWVAILAAIAAARPLRFR
jgi:trehalose-phosphatase